MNKILDRIEQIKAEAGDIVTRLVPEAIKDEQTIYGELCDWTKDYHNDLTLQERELLIEILLGQFAIHHPECISTISGTVMVLCSDEQVLDDHEILLAIRPDDIKKPETINSISQKLRYIFCVDDSVRFDEDDEVEQEFQEAIDNLANGREATFECHKWWWEKIQIVPWTDEVPDGEAKKNQESKNRIMAIEFDSYNYQRQQLAKMTDVEKYYLWKERDEVKGYTLDEFAADFNDENIDTQSWLYFVDATACEQALKAGAEIDLYLVWADSESHFEAPDDEPCIFKDLEAAESQAAAWAHEYDSEPERAIYHVEHLGTGETVSTFENTNNKCDK